MWNAHYRNFRMRTIETLEYTHYIYIKLFDARPCPSWAETLSRRPCLLSLLTNYIKGTKKSLLYYFVESGGLSPDTSACSLMGLANTHDCKLRHY